MIDLERLDACLDLALTDELRVQRATPAFTRVIPDAGAIVADTRPPAPDPAPPPVVSRRGRSIPGGAASRRRLSPTAPSPGAPSPLAPAEMVWDEFDINQHGRAVVELVSQAKLAEADLHIVAHAELAQAARRRDRGDAVGWAVMRALLAGREGAARTGITEARVLDPEGREPGNEDRHWTQRFAVAMAWGDDEERYNVLDHCRERAYCQGDVMWQGRLALLLAVLGRGGEAVREFDSGMATVLGASVDDAGWLDRATDLAEAAAVLGDSHRADLARQGLAGAGAAALVVVGRAWVCKGSVARYQALASAMSGDVAASDGYFRSAAETHRRLGAQVLLARTLGEWGHSLAGSDPQRGAQLKRQSAELSRRLGLAPGHPVFADVAARAS